MKLLQERILGDVLGPLVEQRRRLLVGVLVLEAVAVGGRDLLADDGPDVVVGIGDRACQHDLLDHVLRDTKRRAREQ
jgi:hypothetical protein